MGVEVPPKGTRGFPFEKTPGDELAARLVRGHDWIGTLKPTPPTGS